ncbi:hypothetical protein MIND_01161800 [Mycena indigotica]|uniref:Uncharacterized protein n=1 Tax=Mycena indigotica TaxID=2126181 RepID=A0A8H6S4A3_9AGAR|nr:uncharacterized protein MIND_01161800 [Mycena indigotica]KAF7292639.1 hypothetical protein MIND_01161800 [Mycena indigotica]
METGSCLPPELEREIFELAARTWPSVCFPLLLVARRVLVWIEPMLYRTLTFHERSNSAKIELKTPEFLARHVRHIIISGWANDDPADILRSLPSAEHLALGHDHTKHPQLTAAAFLAMNNLRRLVFYSAAVFPFLSSLVSAATLPVFSQLTHLDLFDSFNPAFEQLYRSLPALTHLSPTSGTHWPTLERLLSLDSGCKHLQALVVFDVQMALPGDLLEMRLVLTHRKPWLHGYPEETWAEGAFDSDTFWDVADEFIAKKRKGLILATNFTVPRDFKHIEIANDSGAMDWT